MTVVLTSAAPTSTQVICNSINDSKKKASTVTPERAPAPKELTPKKPVQPQPTVILYAQRPVRQATDDEIFMMSMCGP